MVVQHNMPAINANRYFGINNNRLSKSLEKLSSGYAINRAGDNAAGLAVSEKMRAQIGGLTQAVKNAQDGISMVQTYEGALTETDSILQRMRSLAVQSSNGTYDNSVDRNAIQKEFDQLNDELNQIADTDFNGVVVLNGGKMADGAKADATGLIDYSNQVRNATDIGSTKLWWGTVDDSMYTKDAADTLWEKTGTSDGVDTLQIKFTYTSDGWKADKTGVTVEETDNGGFTVKADTTEVAKAVFDNSDKVIGDTVTLSFTGGKPKTQAPSQFAVTDDTFNDEKAAGVQAPVGAVTITADKIDENAGKALATLEKGVNIKATLTADGAIPADGTKVEVDSTALNATGTKWTPIGGIDSTLYARYAGGKITFGSLKDGATEMLDDDSTMNIIGTMTVKTSATPDDVKNMQLDFTAQLDKPKYNGVDSYNVSVVASQNPVSVSDANDASTAKLTYSKSIAIQAGARTKDLVDFTFSYDCDAMGDLKADLNCTAEGLGTNKLSLATQESANKAIDKIDNALNKVQMVRSTFGAIQNRLEHKIDNLNTTNENITAAESRIRDTNMAEEMMNFTKNQILSQASQSMLAQANQLPQGVLSLLQ